MKFSLINLAPSFLMGIVLLVVRWGDHISNVIPTIFLVYVCTQGGDSSLLNLVRGGDYFLQFSCLTIKSS